MNALELHPEGLYCTAGQFYIDPWRPVATALITHAHADHARPGMGEYYVTPETSAILDQRIPKRASTSIIDYKSELRLGGARVSFHPAGHILGSSQIRVEVDGWVTVVTGDYKRTPDPTCSPFEVLRCDELITEATFAYPVYRWPDPCAVAADICRWWEEQAAAGRNAVLGCYALGKAQRLLAELHRHTDKPVYLHDAMVELTELYRRLGAPMLPTIPVAETRGARLSGALVLAPPAALATSWMRRLEPAQTAFASGWMQLRGNRRRRGHDRGFVLSDHADWPALLATIEQSGARVIRATHGASDVLVRLLRERGLDASVLRTDYGVEEAA